MDYPEEFDSVARAKMIAAEIEASRMVLERLNGDPAGGMLIPGTSFFRSDMLVFSYVLNVFKAYANEACVLGRSGVWGADKVDLESRKFLKRIATDAQAKYHPRSDFILSPMVSVGSIIPEVMGVFETSPQWQHYQNDLLEVAKFQAQAKNLVPPQMPAILLHIEPAIIPAAKTKLVPIIDKAEREALRDVYFGSFPEKIAVLDMCWAAKQYYREWMRWIGGTLKDGTKADRAFRAVLTSGKLPEEYRPGERRPKGWK